MRIKPEILSPAGYFPQMHAAIEAGADAVYFGLKHFTARAKVGFTLAELPDAMRTLHGRGVKGYVTFNTLVFDHELADAAETIAQIAAAGADAVIVQDIGVAALIRRIAPDLAIHGSTQMSITSAEGVALAARFGVSRVVLARELSLKDMRAIREQTDCELEIFVHGALCVSYSGQCFSSEAWGGRSANRGKCAQACRLPYDLLVDDRVQPLGDARYLLSPGDLAALDHIPEIVEIGISTLKIEGRYKDADYVALTTDAYRRAVDAAWDARPSPISEADALRLEQVYSRGLGAYFISGTDHQSVVSGRAPRHRGVLCGRVVRVTADSAIIQPTDAHRIAPLKPGDGIVFDAADWRSPQLHEEGGRLYQVEARGDQLALRFANHAIDFDRIREGDWVWRTDDADIPRAARPFTHAESPIAKQPVSVHVTARVGEPLTLTWTLHDAGSEGVYIAADVPLTPANQRGATLDSLSAQLDRLGNTPYRLARVTADIDGEPFIPASLLNRLRQAAVAQLERAQAEPRAVTVHDPHAALDAMRHDAGIAAQTPPPSVRASDVRLHLLVRTPEQLEAALTLHPASITLDYLDLYGLRPAVERIKDAGIAARVASPRVLKPQEQRIVNFLLRLDCALVVRSGGLLEALQGRHPYPLIADFSLNAANPLTAAAYLGLGVATLTPTHDLNAAQIAALAAQIGGARLEVIAYQHLPVFHTEHCVFCRFLSTGTSYLDCGHPCERHKVALRDEQGRAHPVMADVGCRNTVFGAEAQTAARHIERLIAAGIADYRLEFVHETADAVRAVVRAFAAYRAGRIDAAELERRLAADAPGGVTEGSLYIPVGDVGVPAL
jgi:putative protease